MEVSTCWSSTLYLKKCLPWRANKRTTDSFSKMRVIVILLLARTSSPASDQALPGHLFNSKKKFYISSGVAPEISLCLRSTVLCSLTIHQYRISDIPDDTHLVSRHFRCLSDKQSFENLSYMSFVSPSASPSTLSLYLYPLISRIVPEPPSLCNEFSASRRPYGA